MEVETIALNAFGGHVGICKILVRNILDDISLLNVALMKQCHVDAVTAAIKIQERVKALEERLENVKEAK